MTDNPNYKITFMLDSAAMITVHTPKRGVVEVGPYIFFSKQNDCCECVSLKNKTYLYAGFTFLLCVLLSFKLCLYLRYSFYGLFIVSTNCIRYSFYKEHSYF